VLEKTFATEVGDKETAQLAREIRRLAPEVPIVIGGHTAAAYPEPFLSGPVDAVVLDDGERALPEIVDAIEKRRPLSEVPGIAVGDQSGGVRRTEANPDAFDLDDVPRPPFDEQDVPYPDVCTAAGRTGPSRACHSRCTGASSRTGAQ